MHFAVTTDVLHCLYMSLFDLAILIIIGGYVFTGFRTGLIQGIGSIVGLVLAAWLAGLWYTGVADRLLPLVGNSQNGANILAFFILFLVLSKLVGIGFYIIDRAFRIIAVVPGMKLMNRLGGAILGFIEGVLFIGLVLTFAQPYASGTVFAAPLAESQFVDLLIGAAGWMAPLLPDIVDRFREQLPNVG